jgi:hypothetical protein
MNEERQPEARSFPQIAWPALSANGSLVLMLGISLGLTAGALWQLVGYARQTHVLAVSWKWQAGLGLMGAAVVVLLLLLAFLLLPAGAKIGRGIEAALAPARLPGLLVWPGIVLMGMVLPILALGPVGRLLKGELPRMLILWLASLAAALMLRTRRVGRSWLPLSLISLMSFGMVYELSTYLPAVSNNPFSLGWSEASRYYYASLFLGLQIYGVPTHPSVLHPTRYMLQAVPFLIGNAPIWVHRLWQVLLWIGLTSLASLLLVRRLRLKGAGLIWLAAVWGFLFFQQGPIYYHLLVMVALLLGAFNPSKVWISMLVVIAASAWAGISRINWVPVPGMLAASLFMLEQPQAGKPWWRYLGWPAAWTIVGAGAGIASQLAYVAASGNSAESFGSSFSSQLLWYRLLPNPTYRLGLLPAVGFASLPILALLFWRRRTWRKILGIWRRLGLTAILGVLLAGGLVVSVKIGGGSNLHNMDAYLAVLAVVGAYAFFGRIRPEAGSADWPARAPGALLASLMLMPVIFAVGVGGPANIPGTEDTARALEAVRNQVQAAVQQHQSVLFISERQLLTFHQVTGAALIPDYETVFLMEMAMAGNQAYLQAFHMNLAAQHYGLIIVDPLNVVYQGRSHAFGEENDAWVRQVAQPVLCYYLPVVSIDSPSVEMLRPRPAPGNCPP